MQTPPTEFAPAERAAKETVFRQSQLFADNGLLQHLYDAMTEVVLIVNRERQIVFSNRRLAELMEAKDRSEIYGLRPGEALGCVHSSESAGGCGTAGACEFCGAVQAILSGQQGRPEIKEARVLRASADALDLLVRTTPMTLAGETFTIVALVDISHEKRRRALERVFFHDLLNTATGVYMLSEMLPSARPEQARELGKSVFHGVRQLIEEVSGQRDLMSAERNELAVRPIEINSYALLQDVKEIYDHYASLKGCRLELDPQAARAAFLCDRAILSRVVGNMVKNAIEASAEGSVVTIDCRTDCEQVRFRVHNPGFMPREVQLQLFMRSFSTKGAGRGLGTYSIKLLTERYLKGKVSFTSCETAGTTFEVACPATVARQ